MSPVDSLGIIRIRVLRRDEYGGDDGVDRIGVVAPGVGGGVGFSGMVIGCSSTVASAVIPLQS